MSEPEASTLNEFKRKEGRRSSYSNYKKTDIDWLGNIPQHWEIHRAEKWLSSNAKKVQPEEMDCEEVKHYSLPNIHEKGDGQIENPDDISSQKKVLTGKEVLVSKLNPENGMVVFPEVNDHTAISSTEFVDMYTEDNVLRRFAYFFYSSESVKQYLSSEAQSVTLSHKRVNPRVIQRIGFPEPPREEQEAIVEFLDKETKKIDYLIGRKEKLIELLEEKRAAIINDLTVSGIDNSKKKDIDINWIDSIPEDWESTSLRNTVDKFVDYRGATPDKSDSGITLITAKNIDNGKLDFSEDHEYVTKEVYDDWMTRGEPEVGDVLITTEAPMGEVAQIQETPVALAQRIILLKVNTDLMKKDFLKYFLNSEFNQTQLMKSQTGSTAKGIQASKLKGIRVFIPPLSEQEKILDEIEQETQKIDVLISKIKESTERLKEYRTALITEAVTGQIAVRGEV